MYTVCTTDVGAHYTQHIAALVFHIISNTHVWQGMAWNEFYWNECSALHYPSTRDSSASPALLPVSPLALCRWPGGVDRWTDWSASLSDRLQYTALCCCSHWETHWNGICTQNRVNETRNNKIILNSTIASKLNSNYFSCGLEFDRNGSI